MCWVYQYSSVKPTWCAARTDSWRRQVTWNFPLQCDVCNTAPSRRHAAISLLQNIGLINEKSGQEGRNKEMGGPERDGNSCWLLNVPATCSWISGVDLFTIEQSANLRLKLQIKFLLSPSMLTLAPPVSTLILLHQARGSVVTKVPTILITGMTGPENAGANLCVCCSPWTPYQ